MGEPIPDSTRRVTSGEPLTKPFNLCLLLLTAPGWSGGTLGRSVSARAEGCASALQGHAGLRDALGSASSTSLITSP